MSIQELEADECRICGCYSNAGFDICEDCAVKQFAEYLKEHIESEHYLFESWIDKQLKHYVEG